MPAPVRSPCTYRIILARTDLRSGVGTTRPTRSVRIVAWARTPPKRGQNDRCDVFQPHRFPEDRRVQSVAGRLFDSMSVEERELDAAAYVEGVRQSWSHSPQADSLGRTTGSLLAETNDDGWRASMSLFLRSRLRPIWRLRHTLRRTSARQSEARFVPEVAPQGSAAREALL